MDLARSLLLVSFSTNEKTSFKNSFLRLVGALGRFGMFTRPGHDSFSLADGCQTEAVGRSDSVPCGVGAVGSDWTCERGGQSTRQVRDRESEAGHLTSYCCSMERNP